jgi:subtilisin-like proprotein convertase family protein
MKITRLSMALATALMISVPALAQEKTPANGVMPSGPAPDSGLGSNGLPGDHCSDEGGTNCPSAVDAITVGVPFSSSFDLPGCRSGTIDDLNVGLDISHTWVGDLKLTLTSPDNTKVVIMDRPGSPPSLFGCSGDNVYAVLDDEGTDPVETTCFSDPAITGTLIPNYALTAFNGQDGAGTWTLDIEDFFGGDDGTLHDWSLDASCSENTNSRATFVVTKDFTDDNPGEVNVTLDCTTGLILDQDKLIAEGETIEFVVTSFDSGELNCTITEDDETGYSAEYLSNGVSSAVECSFEGVGFGATNTCNIINTPDPVTLTANKTWLYPSSEVDTPEFFDLYFRCDNEIVNGGFDGNYWYYDAYGLEGDVSTDISVIPSWDGGSCRVTESTYDSYIEQDVSDCQNVAIELDTDASCDIINTVFYEGIPTLSHYGLAILALSMFGLGMVGFRRYS